MLTSQWSDTDANFTLAIPHARADDGIPRGSVFIAFCYYEAAANKLTNQALDPFAKIAEVKYCAVRLKKGGDMPTELGYHSELVPA